MRKNSLKMILQIAEVSCEILYYIVCWHSPSLSRTVLRRCISSKVEPSMAQGLKMAAGFGSVGEYVG